MGDLPRPAWSSPALGRAALIVLVLMPAGKVGERLGGASEPATPVSSGMPEPVAD